jgi:hypothetical protein
MAGNRSNRGYPWVFRYEKHEPWELAIQAVGKVLHIWGKVSIFASDK